jgi:hypothetical protein
MHPREHLIAREPNGAFKGGHVSFGVGRPRGGRSKLSEDFVTDLYENWKRNGPAAIQKMYKTAVVDYVKVVASILPKNVNVAVSLVEQMSDVELNATILQLSGPGDKDAGGKELPSGVQDRGEEAL